MYLIIIIVLYNIKLKLEGYLQQQRDGAQLSDDQLFAASKFNEVLCTLDFARNLKKQLTSLLTMTKQKKTNTEREKLPAKVDGKIKEVLIFQVNLLEFLDSFYLYTHFELLIKHKICAIFF